jgi:hypothetical protein
MSMPQGRWHHRQRRAPRRRAAGAEAVDRPAAERRAGRRQLLPLAPGKRVYTMGMGKADVERYGYKATDGNYTAPGTRPSAAGHDAAIIRVQVTNPMKVTLAYRTGQMGADAGKLNPRTGKTWGAEDPCISHPRRIRSASTTWACCSAAPSPGRPTSCRSRPWRHPSPGRSRLRWPISRR